MGESVGEWDGVLEREMLGVSEALDVGVVVALLDPVTLGVWVGELVGEREGDGVED